MTGLIGKKIGMTQVFSDDGNRICVTAVEAGPCPVLAVKEKSIQLGFDPVKEKSLKKPQAGYFKKLNISPRKVIKDLDKEPGREYKVGEEIKADLFKDGDFIDVTGTSIGKGFQGGVKRWNWHGGPQTHGSMSHRRPGSIGSTTTPGRVWKGHHMPGHMGHVTKTLQNLRVVKVFADKNIILIKGAVPGPKNSYVVIRKAKKKANLKPAVAPQAATHPAKAAAKPQKKH
jgi:large subunit ribosomal protein L3